MLIVKEILIVYTNFEVKNSIDWYGENFHEHHVSRHHCYQVMLTHT